MFGKNWQTSPREHDVHVDRDVAVPVDDGIDLVGDVFRPDADGQVPVIVSASPYNTEFQSARITPRGATSQNAWIEAGDPYFFARRGYAHVILNVRGTGKSDGQFRNLGPREVTDVVQAIDWLADRPWCDGTAAMTGVSYFGMIQPFVAERDPEPLEAIFCPWAATDLYRDWYYHGGIYQHGMTYKWSQQLDNVRPYSWSRANLRDAEFESRRKVALADEEIRAHDVLVDALENPDEGVNPYLVDTLINRFDESGGYWDERRLDFETTSIPAYFGADWHHTHIHLAAAARNFRNWDGPARLLYGPPQFVDRPMYQLQYEALRWFDHWVKGRETGIEDEPTVRAFRMGSGTWAEADEWPLPETRWTPFYLHPNNVLSEQDHYPGDGFDTIEDSPFGRGEITYYTPEMVERTEVTGPVPVHLYAETTAEEVLFFLTLVKVDAAGEERELTEGWLRGTQRRVDETASRPWLAHHPHTELESVTGIEEFAINVRPTSVVLEPGSRLGLRIRCADVTDRDRGDVDIAHEEIRSVYASGRHLSRQSASRVSIYHDEEHPSRIHLPITGGNVVGTYRSAGRSPPAERAPYRKIWTDDRSEE